MSTKVILAIIGFIIFTIGGTIFSQSLIFGIVFGCIGAVLVPLLDTLGKRKR